ncbi:MAG: serine hydrolase, partial [Myxococcota bacterium]
DQNGEFQDVGAFAADLQPTSDGAWSAADNLLTTVNAYSEFIEGRLTEHRRAASDKSLETKAAHRTTIITDLSDNAGLKCTKGEGIRCPQAVGHSIGWVVHDYGDHRVISHGGNDRGESAMVYYSPEKEHGAVIFVNGGNGILAVVDIMSMLGDEPALAAHYQRLIDRHYNSSR